MSVWTDTSLQHMQGVDPRLVAMMDHLRGLGHDFQISEGLRDQARQQELYDAGKSKTLNSKHLHGNALDVFLVNPETGEAIWDAEAYAPLGADAKAYAAEHGLPFTWGGDWGWDSVHFQLNDGGNVVPRGELDVDSFLNNFEAGLGGGGQQERISTQGGYLPMFQEPQLSQEDRRRVAIMNFLDGLGGKRGRDRQNEVRSGDVLKEEILGRQQRNQTAAWLAASGRPDLADAVLSGALTGQQAANVHYDVAGRNRANRVSYSKTPRFATNPETGERQAYVVGDDGSIKWLDSGNMELGTGITKVDTETGTVLVDSATGQPIGFEGNRTGEKRMQEADVAYRDTIEQYNIAAPQIETLFNHPGLDDAVGGLKGNYEPGTAMFQTLSPEGREFAALHNQLLGGIFLTAFDALKGGGPITDIEGRKATEARQAMNRATSPEAYRRALQQYEAALIRGLEILDRARRGEAPTRADRPNLTMPGDQEPPNPTATEDELEQP